MKNNMSGSIKTEVEADDYQESDLEKESLKILEKLFGSDMFSAALEQELVKINYRLSIPEDGTDYHWFFNLDSKQLQRFHKDIAVEIVTNHNDEKYVCFANGCNYIIPKYLIKEPLEN